MKVPVEGVTPAWGRIRNRVPAEGRYLAERDVETRATVALIGHKLKQDAFGNEEALGREVIIRGVRFRVVGGLKHLGTEQVNDDEMERDNAKSTFRSPPLRSTSPATTRSTPGPSRPTPTTSRTRRRRPRR